MKLFFLEEEALFLEFQLSNGSGWLTSHRLILCEHPRGQLEGHTPVIYFLKDFEKNEVKGLTLISHFKNKRKARINLPANCPSLLQEIKLYIEKASQNHSTKLSNV
jgi:hypothetical protein